MHIYVPCLCLVPMRRDESVEYSGIGVTESSELPYGILEPNPVIQIQVAYRSMGMLPVTILKKSSHPQKAISQCRLPFSIS